MTGKYHDFHKVVTFESNEQCSFLISWGYKVVKTDHTFPSLPLFYSTQRSVNTAVTLLRRHNCLTVTMLFNWIIYSVKMCFVCFIVVYLLSFQRVFMCLVRVKSILSPNLRSTNLRELKFTVLRLSGRL